MEVEDEEKGEKEEKVYTEMQERANEGEGEEVDEDLYLPFLLLPIQPGLVVIFSWKEVFLKTPFFLLAI